MLDKRQIISKASLDVPGIRDQLNIDLVDEPQLLQFVSRRFW